MQLPQQGNNLLEPLSELLDRPLGPAQRAHNPLPRRARSVPQRPARLRQPHLKLTLIGGVASAPHVSGFLEPLQQRRQRARVQLQPRRDLFDCRPSRSQSTSITRYCG